MLTSCGVLSSGKAMPTKKNWEKFSPIFHHLIFEKEQLNLKICDTYTIMKCRQSFSSFVGIYMQQYFPREIKFYYRLDLIFLTNWEEKTILTSIVQPKNQEKQDKNLTDHC